MCRLIDEPVSIDEQKDHMRVDAQIDDALIKGFIQAARQRVEDYTRRALMKRTLKLTINLPSFEREIMDGDFLGVIQPGYLAEIRLPRPPLIRIVEVKYYHRGR